MARTAWPLGWEGTHLDRLWRRQLGYHDLSVVERALDLVIAEHPDRYPPAVGVVLERVRALERQDGASKPGRSGPPPADLVHGLRGADREQVEQAWRDGYAEVAVRAIAAALRRVASGAG
jgi:hypothetical protein